MHAAQLSVEQGGHRRRADMLQQQCCDPEAWSRRGHRVCNQCCQSVPVLLRGTGCQGGAPQRCGSCQTAPARLSRPPLTDPGGSSDDVQRCEPGTD
jgi:hypothetical protein